MLGREKRLRKRENRIAGLVRKEEIRQSEKGINKTDPEFMQVRADKMTDTDYDTVLLIKTDHEEAYKIERMLLDFGIKNDMIVRKSADNI